MAEFKTLEFQSTPAGQKAKIKSLQEHSNAGWRVVSETLQPTSTDASDAFCGFCGGFFCCGPWGAVKGLEGAKNVGKITVTLTRG